MSPVKYIDRFIESDDLSSDLELEAKSNEGFIIKDIYAESSTVGEYITVIISDTVMFSCIVEIVDFGMLRFPDPQEIIKGLFSNLREKYPEIPLFRISEGEKLVITANSGTIKCLVRYVHLIGAEMPKSTEFGGTLSDNRLLLSSGSESFTVSADLTDYLKTLVSVNPSGIITFPFGTKVPSGYELDLLGFCIAIKKLTGTGIVLDGIRLWFKDESILKPNQEYQSAELFNYITTNGQLKPFLFDSPIKMVAGDELKLEAQITGTATDTGVIYATFIFNQKKV